MRTTNQSRLSTLLQQKRRATRVPALVKAWGAMGAKPSVMSDDLHAELVARLRQHGQPRSPVAGTLSTIIGEFAKPLDLIVVAGWCIDDEPALLVPAEIVARSEPHLRTTYPDGLIIVATPLTRALIIDFDEGAMQVDEVRLSPAF